MIFRRTVAQIPEWTANVLEKHNSSYWRGHGPGALQVTSFELSEPNQRGQRQLLTTITAGLTGKHDAVDFNAYEFGSPVPKPTEPVK